MTNSNMRQTIFNIEKLKSAVNVGNCSAYQIYTSLGEQIGQIGTVVEPGTQMPANEGKFPAEAKVEITESSSTTWFRRVLAALK